MCGRLPCPLARNLPPRTKVSNLTRAEFANVICTECANLTYKEHAGVEFAKRLTLSRFPFFSILLEKAYLATFLEKMRMEDVLLILNKLSVFVLSSKKCMLP